MLDKGYPVLVTCINGETSDLDAGTPVAWDRSALDGLTVKKMVATNMGDFAGILVKPLPAGEQSNNALCVEGVCYASFLNSASATAGTWAEPVAGQTYLQLATHVSRIEILSDQSSGTDAHYVADEGNDGPALVKIWKRGEIKTMVLGPLAEAASYYFAAPEHLRVVEMLAVNSGDPGASGMDVTLDDGTNTAAVAAVANGAAAGTVTAATITTATDDFTEGELMKLTLENATNAISAVVIIKYVAV